MNRRVGASHSSKSNFGQCLPFLPPSVPLLKIKTPDTGFPRRKMQEDFQVWYEPLVDAEEETTATPRAEGNHGGRAPVSEGHSTLSDSNILRGDRRANNSDMRDWSCTNISERRMESDRSQDEKRESPSERASTPVAAWGHPSPEPKTRNKSSKSGGKGFHRDNGGVSLTGEFQYPLF